MGVYTRYKRDPGGFRAIVELLESTPPSKREKMIAVGMQEDEDYTQKILKYVMSFQDLIDMPELELSEVMGKAPPKMIGYALHGLQQIQIDKFLRCCLPQVAAEVKDTLTMKIGPTEIGGARLRVISSARELEKSGKINTKRIPIKDL